MDAVDILVGGKPPQKFSNMVAIGDEPLFCVYFGLFVALSSTLSYFILVRKGLILPCSVCVTFKK